MSTLSKKLARLREADLRPGDVAGATTGDVAVQPTNAPESSPQASVLSDVELARRARIDELRERVRALAARAPVVAKRASAEDRESALDSLPFVREEREDGAIDVRRQRYPVTARHGHVPLHSACDVRAESVALLTLDRSKIAPDLSRALYIDTETTGLNGGTGMMAFLVGAGRFEQRTFVVEQWFLRDPSDELAMLLSLRERMAAASCLVSFNGKSFDLPLLRARFVMNRLEPPAPLPHVDLVHVARRIYGKRMDQCKLTSLERDVLGFVREGDVPSGEIPARYLRFLRLGDSDGLHAVVEHNLWDVIAMAALLGELGARAGREESPGRLDPSDLAGLAQTALRAGNDQLALALAGDAMDRGALAVAHGALARAGGIAASVHRRRGEHTLSRLLLHTVLDGAPDDPGTHLALSKLYEHRFKDPFRALAHARLAEGAEKPAARAKRVERLATRVAKSTARLPGFE
ncbi:MAG: ribonuclease H-like domain-containing protein [Deltaproteobacteria bacterium]|nr:ribonuclease H-like domain-containing protein [Deltaproteobacteria bacterium]